MLIKNSKIIQMHAVISAVADRDFGVGHGKFKWGLSKNQDALAKAFEDLDKFRKPRKEYAEEWNEYQREREETIQKFAATDEDGKFIIDERRNEYVIPSDKREEYKEASKPVADKYAEVVEKHKETLKEFEDILEEESDLRVHKINIELMPDAVRSSEMTTLMPLWYDPEDEEDCKVVEMKSSKKSEKKKKKAN